MKKTIIKLWNSSKWHLLAFVFTFVYTWLGNAYNFMYLCDAQFNQIVGSQYAFQLFICTFTTFIVAYVVELYQMTKGANGTHELWDENARPDILVSTFAGLLGSLIYLLILYIQL